MGEAVFFGKCPYLPHQLYPSYQVDIDFLLQKDLHFFSLRC